MSLHRPTAGHAPVLDDAPVAMLLAVPGLRRGRLFRRILWRKNMRRLPKPAAVSQDTWSAPQAVFAVSLTDTSLEQNSRNRGPVAKVGLGSGLVRRLEVEADNVLH